MDGSVTAAELFYYLLHDRSSLRQTLKSLPRVGWIGCQGHASNFTNNRCCHLSRYRNCETTTIGR